MQKTHTIMEEFGCLVLIILKNDVRMKYLQQQTLVAKRFVAEYYKVKQII